MAPSIMDQSLGSWLATVCLTALNRMVTKRLHSCYLRRKGTCLFLEVQMQVLPPITVNQPKSLHYLTVWISVTTRAPLSSTALN